MSNTNQLKPPVIVTKPNCVQVLGTINIEPLLSIINRFPEHFWERENATKDNDYPVFHSTKHIVLRFIEHQKDPRFYYSKPSWQALACNLLPLMNEVSDRLGIKAPEYPKAMFARLQAGGRIDPHIDHGISHKHVHKIHIPLISHPDVVFFTAGNTYYLEPGKAYEVNNLKEHGVDNPSDIDRVHFIFEVFKAGY